MNLSRDFFKEKLLLSDAWIKFSTYLTEWRASFQQYRRLIPAQVCGELESIPWDLRQKQDSILGWLSLHHWVYVVTVNRMTGTWISGSPLYFFFFHISNVKHMRCWRWLQYSLCRQGSVCTCVCVCCCSLSVRAPKGQCCVVTAGRPPVLHSLQLQPL